MSICPSRGDDAKLPCYLLRHRTKPIGLNELTAIAARCPVCSSGNVFYSCHTSCCFNHVCGDCRATFELSTEAAGGIIKDPMVIPAERDTSLPMAPCATCNGVEVYGLAGDSRLICAACGSQLTLRYEKVTADR